MKKSFRILVACITIACLTANGQINISVPKIGNKKKNEQPNESTIDQNTKTTKKYSKEEKTKILDKNSYPTYDTDKKILERVAKVYFGNVSSFGLKNHETYNDTLKRIETRYHDYWALYNSQPYESKWDGSTENLQRSYQDASNNIAKTKSYLDNAANNVTAYCDNALSTAQRYAKEKRITDDLNKNVFKEYVKEDLAMASLYADHVAKVKGESDAAPLRKKITDTENQTETLRVETEKEIMKAYEAVKCPVEVYNGADKAAIKKIPKEAYSTNKILGMFIVDKDWVKYSGKEWVGNKLVDYNYSMITVDVVMEYKDEPSRAYICKTSVIKNHLQNDKMYVKNYGLTPCGYRTEMLSKNVK